MHQMKIQTSPNNQTDKKKSQKDRESKQNHKKPNKLGDEEQDCLSADKSIEHNKNSANLYIQESKKTTPNFDDKRKGSDGPIKITNKMKMIETYQNKLSSSSDSTESTGYIYNFHTNELDERETKDILDIDDQIPRINNLDELKIHCEKLGMQKSKNL
mmetsp:Transcript_6478/g.14001  ORF Transcript_6478/g.14001 Transcript_6478/m.14001 type:complete len:158 (+) Transcript_6478:957-1430(+)